MIPDLAYICNNLNVINQVKFRLIYQLSSLDIVGLYAKGLYYLFNVLTSIESIIRLVILTKLMSA